MKEFEEALVCKCKNERIPEEFNYFEKVIGEWDLDWNDRLNTSTPRRVKGEWIFSWVLDGMAVQDVFIVPSRAERLIDIQPDAAYGTTIRLFNTERQVWEIFYGCPEECARLEACKEGDEIILTEITSKAMKWIFSDITDNSFSTWRGIAKKPCRSWITLAESTLQRNKNSNLS
ncbi:MAG: hypothetical protein ACLVEJ_11450 [Parabacteroides sp.]